MKEEFAKWRITRRMTERNNWPAAADAVKAIVRGLNS